MFIDLAVVVDMGIKIPGIQFQYQDENNLNNQTNRSRTGGN